MVVREARDVKQVEQAGKLKDNAPMTAADRAALLRQIPSVDDLLSRPRLAGLAQRVNRALVVDAARETLDEIRAAISRHGESAAPSPAVIEQRIESAVARLLENLLGGKVAPELVSLVMERSDGNPYFGEQIIRYLQDENLIEMSPAGWALVTRGRGRRFRSPLSPVRHPQRRAGEWRQSRPPVSSHDGDRAVGDGRSGPQVDPGRS